MSALNVQLAIAATGDERTAIVDRIVLECAKRLDNDAKATIDPDCLTVWIDFARIWISGGPGRVGVWSFIQAGLSFDHKASPEVQKRFWQSFTDWKERRRTEQLTAISERLRPVEQELPKSGWFTRLMTWIGGSKPSTTGEGRATDG